MSTRTEIKNDIHNMNGLIGKMAFSIDELFDLKKNKEEITNDHLNEIQETFDEIKETWKKVRSGL